MKSDANEKRDWRVSVILLAIWAIAMSFLWSRGNDIPLSMIGIATVFFVFLIPAMNDLVRSIEKWAFGRPDDFGGRKGKS